MLIQECLIYVATFLSLRRVISCCVVIFELYPFIVLSGERQGVELYSRAVVSDESIQKDVSERNQKITSQFTVHKRTDVNQICINNSYF